MWIFLNNSYLSCVENRNKPDTLCVRARFKGDIEEVFPEAHVYQVPKSDYAYRAVIDKAVVAGAIAKAILEIDYDNFKNSVFDSKRHSTYAEVWQVMYAAQCQERSRLARKRS